MLHCPRNVMRTLVYSGLLLSTGLAPALAADPTGDWRVADGVANIRVAECNGSMWGVGGVGESAGRPRHQQSRCFKTEQADPGHADPDRHEEDAWRRSMGRPSLQRQGRPVLQFHDQAEPVPTSLRFKAACWASCAAAKPGPASPARFPRAPSTAWPRARRRPQTEARTPRRLRRRLRQPGARRCTGQKTGGHRRSGRRYLPTPRHRAVYPLAPAGTTTPRPAS